MNVQRSLIVLGLFTLLVGLSSCSPEPKTAEGCIEKYSRGVQNTNAVREITKACAGIFDAKKTDDAYYKCLLGRLPGDKTDEDVNISIRQCTMKTAL